MIRIFGSNESIFLHTVQLPCTVSVGLVKVVFVQNKMGMYFVEQPLQGKETSLLECTVKNYHTGFSLRKREGNTVYIECVYTVFVHCSSAVLCHLYTVVSVKMEK